MPHNEELVEFPLTNEDTLDVKNWWNKFNSVVEQDDSNGNRGRLYEAFNYYSGVNKGQWNPDTLEYLRNNQRPAHTFNHIQPIVDFKQGQLKEEPIQVKFDPLEHTEQDELDILQNLFDYDWNRGKGERAWDKFTRDGLIHTGVLKMYVDFSQDVKGNLSLRHENPCHLWFDVNWQTNDIRDVQYCFNATWLTAAQIKEQFNTKSDFVDNAIRVQQFSTDDNQEFRNKAADSSARYFNRISNQWKVIEVTYMQKETIRKVMDLQGKKIDKFSAVMFQKMPKEDLEKLLRNQGIAYKIEEQTVNMCKLFTFAPGLSWDLVLAKGYYPLQLGSVPYLVWSAKNVFGQRQGIIDILKDAQDTINKRQSMITHALGTAGLNNYLVEDDAFVDQAGLLNFKRNQAKGGQTFTVASDTNQRKKVAIQERPAIPNDLLNASNKPEETLEKLANVTPAARGNVKSGESSALFTDIQAASQISNQGFTDGLMEQMEVFGELYFYAAKQWYSNVPRKFVDRKNKREFEVNQLGVAPDGEIVTRNDISKLPRHAIMVSESPSGRTKAKENLSKYIELKRVSTNPIMQSLFEKYMIPSLGLPEDEMKKLEEAADKFTEFQLKQIDSQIAQMDSVTAQLAAQSQGQPQPGAPQDNRAIAKSPGAGPIPSEAGIAGGQGSGNNASNNAPSDFSGA